MSVLDRKLGRELLASWGMLLAITSIVTIGVACYVAMGSAYYNLGEAKARYPQSLAAVRSGITFAAARSPSR